ncbi:hypothetical protein TNCV_1471791 [Trichonephila clavipes]|nr:hypothetical protein TNCV_1471791 [Trichonephila clavipes]
MRAKAYCTYLDFRDLGHRGACVDVPVSVTQNPQCLIRKRACFSFNDSLKGLKVESTCPVWGLNLRLTTGKSNMLPLRHWTSE